MKYLIDSNIFIYHLNGEDIASSFLQNHQFYSAISRITYIEVLSFYFDSIEQENDVKKLLAQFELLELNQEIADQALSNRKRKKIKMADNIIAATAQLYDLILVSRNINDFKALDITILNPFEI